MKNICITDKGKRWSGIERREFSYTAYFPERRSGKDRRGVSDRRSIRINKSRRDIKNQQCYSDMMCIGEA
jgi:hypothetical protein